jgi:hypothetical protein
MSGNKILLPLLSAVVVAGGSTAAYFYFTQGAPDEAMGPRAIAKVIPDEAYAAAFISTDENAWAQLEKFGTPEAQKLIGQGLKDWNQKLLTDAKVELDQDLKPWASNIMIAFLPSPTTKPAVKPTGAKSQAPNFMVVVGVKDRAKADSFVSKLKSESKTKSSETAYKNTQITDYASEGESIYTAHLKDFLVIAPEKKAIEQAIDTVQGEPSLASKPDADSLFTKSADVQNPLIRFYLTDYYTAMQEMVALNKSQAMPLSPAMLEPLKQVKSIVANLGIDDAGLRLRALTTLDPKMKMQQFSPAAGSVVSQFPAETFALVSGAGIKQYWAQAVEQSTGIPQSQMAIGAMRSYTQMVGLDLDKDIFGWMDGEFALGMMPVNEGPLAQIGFGGVMLFDTSDRKTAEATFSTLDALVQTVNLSVGQRDVSGKQITEWQAPGQGTLLGHGWLDNDTVFVAMGQPLIDLIVNKPAQPLNNSDVFKTITGSLPKQNMGYFYLDMDQTMALVKRMTPPDQKNSMKPEAEAVLNSIRGVGMTSTRPDQHRTQVELLLSLKPAK